MQRRAKTENEFCVILLLRVFNITTQELYKKSMICKKVLLEKALIWNYKPTTAR